jgi:chemotaxis protein CheX
MNNRLSSSDIRDYIGRHLVDVFDTMLSSKAAPAAEVDPSQFAARITGSVGFAGETVTGSVYLHLPGALAGQATATMLGMTPPEAPGDGDVNDVVGEVTNMLGGGLKSSLCDTGAKCALTAPAIIRGDAFTIVPSEGVERIQLGFDCGSHHGMIEIHIKFIG